MAGFREEGWVCGWGNRPVGGPERPQDVHGDPGYGESPTLNLGAPRLGRKLLGIYEETEELPVPKGGFAKRARIGSLQTRSP